MYIKINYDKVYAVVIQVAGKFFTHNNKNNTLIGVISTSL